jgi:hypothetical protein
MTRWLIVPVFVAASAAAAVAQNAMEPIRQLYESAEYEAALAAIGRLETPPSPANEGEVDRYRALCLIALGRSNEAESVIEDMVTRNPMYEPGENEASPRVRTAFTTVRGRVLPAVARSKYTEGKAAYDRKEFAAAAASLQEAVDIMATLPGDGSLGDLRVLANGFLDLSRASLAPAAPAAPAPAAASAEAPVVSPRAQSVGPVTIRQDMPVWNPVWFGNQGNAEYRGAIEVDIDERGDVVGTRIIVPIHPAYDQVLLEAAKAWKYEPARQANQAVKISKRVDVVLRPR